MSHLMNRVEWMLTGVRCRGNRTAYERAVDEFIVTEVRFWAGLECRSGQAYLGLHPNLPRHLITYPKVCGNLHIA